MATEKRLMSIDDFKRNLCHYCNTYMSEEPCEPSECWVHDVIAQTDTADAVEVVHGRWEKAEEFEFISGEYVTTGYHCDQCGCYYKKRSNYCSNCGADMRERKDND